MSILKVVLFILFLAAGIGFAIQNDQPVSLQYYFGWASTPLPLFLWAFLSLLAGLAISGVIATLSKFSLRSKNRQLKRKIAELERQRAERQAPSRQRNA